MILKYLKYLLLVFCLVAGVSAVTINGNDRLFEISKNIEIFVNVFKELNKNYVDEVDPAERMRTGIDAMVNSLDPFTNYISESQVERYRITDDERFQGIGAGIVFSGERVLLSDLLDGGTAVGAGLHAGDEIISINGEIMAGKNEEEIQTMLRGIAGTPVKLDVKRNGTGLKETITVERGEVNIPNVPYAGIVSDGIAYIHLTTFTDNAGANIQKELKRLKREAADSNAIKGLILDLRYNGGGLLREAVNICNLFIPKGEEVVFTRGKLKEKDQSFKTMAIPYDLDLPIAVLINKKSASASEIVSGVIQDKDRGVIIGQRSYGKGLVQNTFELGYNNRVKITTSKYYIPSGRCIQGVEYKNGEPVDIADARRSKFKTKNGRTVLDGGGITPDYKLDAHEPSDLTNALLDQKLIFLYVNDYVINRDSVKNVDNFTFSDYDDFLSFIRKRKFEYESDGEKEINALLQKCKNDESLQTLIGKDLSAMKEKVNVEKSKAWTAHKEEIVTELEKEIVSRYFYQQGKTRIGLKRDKEVDEAIALLKDQKRYESILQKK
ncbi:MAG: S41 family peptidase [Saprospiraceae bacterium]|nr:S41 family peptidase [Saprospiraceae bacterium]